MATIQRLTGVNREGVRGLFIRRKPDYVDNILMGSLAGTSLTIPTNAHVAKIVTDVNLWAAFDTSALYPSANVVVGTAPMLISSALGDIFDIGNGVTSIRFISAAAGRFSIEWYK